MTKARIKTFSDRPGPPPVRERRVRLGDLEGHMGDRQRLVSTAIWSIALAVSLSASVVVKESAVTIAGDEKVETEIVYSINGGVMRIHRPRAGAPTGRVHIFDASAGRLIVLYPDRKEAEIYDAAKASAEIEKRLPSDRITADLKPTGKTRDVLGTTCDEYAFVVKAPATDSVMIVRTGTACVGKQGRSAEEYAAFFRSAETVLVAGSLTVPKNFLAVDRSETELYRRLAALGGIPYAIEMKLEVEGRGMTAGLLKRAVAASRSVTVTAVDTTPLHEQMFTIPAGWKTKRK